MPGYILHLTEAALACRILEAGGMELTPQWKNRFFLGNLLPDTKRKTEKVTSHFWNPDTLVQLAIPPDLELFERRYKEKTRGPLMLGYQMHLTLDACYVNEFWDHILEFRTDESTVGVLKKEITRVWLKYFQKEIPVEDFFSGEYYYGDYTRMNGALLKKYQLQVPVYEEGLACPVKETDPADLCQVLAELRALCETASLGEEEQLRVFDMEDLEQFILKMAERGAGQIKRMDPALVR